MLSLTLPTVLVLFSSASLLYVIRLLVNFVSEIQRIRNFPGRRYLLCPTSIYAVVFPFHVPYIATGAKHPWIVKHDDFKRYKTDIISNVSAWPRAQISFDIADAAAAKEVAAKRTLFPKPLELYELPEVFGSNIVGTEGDEWKRHRNIAYPAFSEPNNRFVWDEAVRITLDMMDNVWKDADEMNIDHAAEMTLTLALLVIGSAGEPLGFGHEMSFSDDKDIPAGHTMSFKESIHVVCVDMILGAVVPSWLSWVSERTRNHARAVKELRSYMQEMIDDRRTSGVKSDRCDLFRNLLDANSGEFERSDSRLSDNELIGNIFIFLLAGHETSAHSICFALALLALYPEEQDATYRNIVSVLDGKSLPAYEDMNSLNYVLAVFYETLRLFPPVGFVAKKAAEDTTLTTINTETNDVVNVPIPKNSMITIYTNGLHYNPRYWEDPNEFKPKRFLKDWPRDAFVPFSIGQRSCVGRRFSETESIAILAVILSRYRIEVKAEPQFASETFEERKARVLSSKQGLTLT
ncbi:614/534 cytochrome P450 [Schizopora paradoxa]|uniref:614/534 cytochrome P450 n=1 Tax=Schizopora paradoxa TaxID=27342 RepID=A0A0H2RFX7_9AGAM|nr:614/534 cytochrome P450 [Schizopora paradoxa]